MAIVEATAVPNTIAPTKLAVADSWIAFASVPVPAALPSQSAGSQRFSVCPAPLRFDQVTVSLASMVSCAGAKQK